MPVILTNLMLNIILLIAAAYLLCGFVFSIAFVIKGISVVDEGAHGASTGFRIIILPGVIVFWPVLLRKWLLAKKKILMSPAKE
jgi:hypothetical protein